MNRQNEPYRAAWAEYYFSTFKKIGIPCFWWDNGAMRYSVSVSAVFAAPSGGCIPAP